MKKQRERRKVISSPKYDERELSAGNQFENRGSIQRTFLILYSWLDTLKAFTSSIRSFC